MRIIIELQKQENKKEISKIEKRFSKFVYFFLTCEDDSSLEDDDDDGETIQQIDLKELERRRVDPVLHPRLRRGSDSRLELRIEEQQKAASIGVSLEERRNRG